MSAEIAVNEIKENMMKRNYTNLVLASVFVLLASCATLSDEEKYERADRFVQAVDQFRLKQITCRNSGGVIVMQRTGNSRSYSLLDYKFAECTL